MKTSIRTYCEHRIDEQQTITGVRKEALNKLVAYLRYKEANPVHFLFIEEDNSRTSHFLKVWTMVAVHYYQQTQIDAFCIGKTKTSVQTNVIKTLMDIGFDILVVGSESNPTYALRFGDELPPCMCSSKDFSDILHWPKNMACISIEQEEEKRKEINSELDLYLPYNNPIAKEGTSEEDETYYQLCAKVAREVFYVFDQVFTA